jgi:pheromone shutdown protein TraB
VSEPEPNLDQGREWVEFIRKELDREYTRRDLINSRSAGTITSATALVTISLAVVAVVKGEHYTVAGALHVWLLAGALLSLLGAAVLSILAGSARGGFSVAAVKDMRRMLSAELWASNPIDARNYTAQLDLIAIRTLRTGNTTKYRFLVLALTAQALGIFLLGIFAVVVIVG